MKCMVCGKALKEYAVIGKKKDIKVAFCVDHIPDCSKCDSCDLVCLKCGDIKIVRNKGG